LHQDTTPEESIPMWKISLDEVPGKPGFTIKTPLKVRYHAYLFQHYVFDVLKLIIGFRIM
jgi:hypothetical protein